MDGARLERRPAAVTVGPVEIHVGRTIHVHRAVARNDSTRFDRCRNGTVRDLGEGEFVGPDVDRTSQRQLATSHARGTPRTDKSVAAKSHAPGNNRRLTRSSKGSCQRTRSRRTTDPTNREVIRDNGAIPDAQRATAAYHNVTCAQGIVVGIRTRTARTCSHIAFSDVCHSRLTVAAGQIELADSGFRETTGTAYIATDREIVPRAQRHGVRVRERKGIANAVRQHASARCGRCRDRRTG